MANEFNLDEILKMFSAGPTPQERQEAASQAFARAGMGILAGNQPSAMPRNPYGVLGQGGMAGMDAYGGALSGAMAERKAGGAAMLQALQFKKQLEQQAAIRGLFSPQPALAGTAQPAPEAPQPTGLSPSSASAIGAPWAAMQAVPQAPAPTAPPQAPQAAAGGGFQPIPVQRLAEAAAGGVNIEPFLKLNAEARPHVIHIDAGNKTIVMDTKSMKILQEIPKGAAPGHIPFEASDISAPAFRDFLLSKSSASASKNITNVNAFVPASEEAQRRFMDSTRTTYDQLKQAPVALASIEQAKALIPSAKGFLGPGGESLLGAAKFLNNRLGMSIDTEGVKGAEELRTRIFFNIMDNLKKMDAQPSQQQQKIMQEALGNLGTDPNALPKVLDAFGDVIRGKVALHNKEVQGAVQRGVRFPYDPTITLEAKPASVRRYNPNTGKIE